MTNLISASELQGILGQVKPVDATYSPPVRGVSGAEAYLAAHIPGAVHFDIDSVCDRQNPLPHMFPAADDFFRQIGEMGVAPHDQVVIYDQFDISMAASRVWWMFKTFGHKNVRVLNGGLRAWLEHGGETESGGTHMAAPVVYPPQSALDAVRSADDVLQISSGARTGKILDVRDPARFNGGADPIWQGRQTGHIPNSLNLFFRDMIDPQGCLKPVSELQPMFDALGLDTEDAITTSCGSGVTACVALLALTECGYKNLSLYDGSWAEWGLRTDLPIAVSGA